MSRVVNRATLDHSDGPASAAVDVYLSGLELEEGLSAVQATMARVAAAKLDACLASSAVASAGATPRLLDALGEILSLLDDGATSRATEAALRKMLLPLGR